MYNEHFGLRRAPFRITPDTKLFYPGGNRGEILDALIYAISSGEGIVKVVGEVGSGKTMLCRMLEERLGDTVDIVYLANPSLSPEDTLHAIALEMKLDVGPDANRLQVMHALQERLLEKHAAGRQVVVFVEEAQSMPIATLEEIRLLSNLETKRDKLLQIVLFGQPELDQNLEQPEIRQLKERITHSFYLDAFTPEQMREYVNFRMRAVGYRGPDIFRGAAYRRMAKASAGLTRRINILADKALLAAFAEDTFDVSKRHVKIAINDSQFVRARRWGLPEISLVSGVILIVAAVAWTLLQRSDGLSDNLRHWLPWGDAREMARPMEPRATAAPEAVAAAETPAAPAGGTDGAQETAGAPADATPEAPTVADAQENAGEPAPVREGTPGTRPLGDSETIRTAAVSEPAMPVAEGGSRLMLSDTLSRPVFATTPAKPAEPPVAEPAPETLVSHREPAAVAGSTPVVGPTSTGDEASATESVAMADPGSSDRETSQEPVAVEPASVGPASVEPASVEPASVGIREDVGPLTQARLAATRDWLETADGGHFSIQLLLTDFARRDNLERFLRERQAAGEVEDYYVFETRIRRNVWFGVLYKEYPSFGAAKAALEDLPEEFRFHQPFIRNVRDIATLG